MNIKFYNKKVLKEFKNIKNNLEKNKTKKTNKELIKKIKNNLNKKILKKTKNIYNRLN